MNTLRIGNTPRIIVACTLLLVAASVQAGSRKIGAVEFASCDLSTPRSGRVEALCATVPVPENHDDPAGRKIELRVALVEARARNPEPDVILFLAGGPGQSAVDAYPMVLKALNPLTRRRHVLLVDQRGTGESNPLHCALPDWKQEQALTPAAARADARKCLERQAGKADTRFYATSDYVRDLEFVRKALGIGQFNVMGGSYGTRVALEYLRRHPDSTRSLFIDSVVPPELALLQDHAVNLEDALKKTSDRCIADEACDGRFGDMRGTLQSLLVQVQKSPQVLTIPDPSTHRPIKVPFNEAALLWVMRFFSYSPDSASLLPLLLHEAADGNPQPLVAQAEMLARTLPDELAHGLELSVICAEDADLLQVRDEDRQTLIGAEGIEYLQAQCEVWPHGVRPPDFKDPVVSRKPVLLLSGEYDPVTPPRYADHVASTLANSRHLLAKGQGHTPMAQGCMPLLLSRFIEGLDPKGLDASCLEALGDTPFFLGYEGPAP